MIGYKLYFVLMFVTTNSMLPCRCFKMLNDDEVKAIDSTVQYVYRNRAILRVYFFSNA